MFDIKAISLSKRKSVKRATARFLYTKNITLQESNFNTLVRRTQDSGYPSAIRFLSHHLHDSGYATPEIRQLLLQFTIEYNVETYCRQFPSKNKTIERILSGDKNAQDEIFFKESLYPVVKANKLQLDVINKYS